MMRSMLGVVTTPWGGLGLVVLLLAVLVLAVLLPGCALATPVRGPGYAGGSAASAPPLSPGQEQVRVGITHAVVEGPAEAEFMAATMELHGQLERMDGFLGVSLRRRLGGGEVWTMTLWRDQAALEAFVRSPEHRRAIGRGMPAVASARFLQFWWPAAEPPPTWAQVEAKLAEVPFKPYRQQEARR